MMKKYMMLLVLVCMSAQIWAQPALGKGSENKKVDAEEMLKWKYAGQYGKLDCWVVEGKKHVKQVVMNDLNLVTQYSATLPGSGDYDVIAASKDMERIAVLVADQSKKKSTVLGLYRVSLDSCGVIGGGMDTLKTFEYGKKDVCKVWGAVSPSGNYMAMVTVVEYVETSEYGTFITLFDGGGNLQWEKEFALGTMSEMRVTDDGRVVTLGLEQSGKEQCVVVNLLTEESGRSSKIFLQCDPMRKMRLASVSDDHIIAVGVYGFPDGKQSEHLTAGIVTLAFNLDSASLTKASMRPFNNEDINIYYNKSTKKIQRYLACEDFELIDVMPTESGCAALYGRRYRVSYTNSTGGTAYEYVCMGLGCVAVDTMGNVQWVRNLRRNDIQKEDGSLLGVSLVNANGQVGVMKSEHKKYPLQYEIGKEAKELTLNGKANNVLYTIDKEGTVKKLIVEKAQKQNLVRAITRQDGSLLMLTSTGGKSRAAELRFVY